MQKTASIPENRSSKLFRALGGILSNKEQCASKFKSVRIGDSSMPNGGSFRAQPKKKINGTFKHWWEYGQNALPKLSATNDSHCEVLIVERWPSPSGSCPNANKSESFEPYAS